MLLQTSVRLPSQPLEGAEPVQLRPDSSESKRQFERTLSSARRSAGGDRAAVVQFGAVALGLARSQEPVPDSTRAEPEPSDDGEAPEATGSDAAGSAASTSEPEAASRGAAAAASSAEEEPSEDERAEVDQMKRRDREVRTHEQAHKAAGGGHTGSIRLSYQMGPDGKRYAVEGSVSIDVSPVAGDPAATLRKMEVVHRAANAPASPSGADRAVAAQAQRASQQARAQMAAERYAQASELVPRA